MDFEVLTPLLNTHSKGKIVLLVMDGLGGLPMEEGGMTELEAAKTPNMDALAKKSMLVCTRAFARASLREAARHIFPYLGMIL